MRTLIIDNFSNDYGDDYINITVVDENGVVPIADEHKEKLCILVGPNEYRVDAYLNEVEDYILNPEDYGDDVQKYVSLIRQIEAISHEFWDRDDYETFRNSEQYREMKSKHDALNEEAFGMQCANMKLKDVLVWKGLGRDEFCKLYNIGTIVVTCYDIEFDNNPNRRYSLDCGDINTKHTFDKNKIIKV